MYLLPWTFAMISFGSDIIAKESRQFLLELALHLLMFFYLDETESAPYLNEQGAAISKVMPLKMIALTRAMSAIIGLMYALVELDWELPLDRISTHPLENFCGPPRRLVHDCSRFDELLHVASGNAIMSQISDGLQHPRDICGQVNAGG
jgi:hypothetical protein